MSYEFKERENIVIDKAALWSRVLGAVVIAEAVVGLREIAANPIGPLVSLVVALIVGIAFVRAGSAFKRVVDTEGDDVLHMMEAMQQLGRAFTIRIALMVIALVLIGVALLFFGTMAASYDF